MSDFRPWDITNLVDGAFVTALAPDTEPIPTWVDAVRAMVSPYTFGGSFFKLGAGVDSRKYQSGFEEQGLQIQEESGDILSAVSNRTVGMTADLAEIEPGNIGILENSTNTEAVSGSSGVGAGTSVGIGDIEDLIHYRGVLMGLRPLAAGKVIEPSGLVRGRIVAVTLNDVTLSANSREIEFDKSGLAHAPVNFKAYPVSGEASDVAYGRWMFEDAGAIPA